MNPGASFSIMVTNAPPTVFSEHANVSRPLLTLAHLFP